MSKRCSTSFVIGEMQIKMTRRDHSKTIRMDWSLKHQQNQLLVRIQSNRNSHLLLIGAQNGMVTFEGGLAVSPDSCKAKHSLIKSSNHVPRIYQTGVKIYVHTKSCIWIIHNCQKTGNNQDFFGEWIKLQYIYPRILCSNLKKERSMKPCKDMDKS